MNTDEVLKQIKEQDVSALDLINQYDPNLQMKFKKAMTALKQVIEDVRILYPDATFYVHDDCFCLMLGDSHSANECHKANFELVAFTDENKLAGAISGGGF